MTNQEKDKIEYVIFKYVGIHKKFSELKLTEEEFHALVVYTRQHLDNILYDKLEKFENI